VSDVLFFMVVSANGYYERGPWGIDWHHVDEEFNEFAISQLDSVDALVFGRKTYEGMARYWPTPEAIASDPAVAGRMNGLAKVVVSRTLERAEWANTRIVRADVAGEVAKLKRESPKGVLVMGSSDLAASLSGQGLIDEYRLMVNPIFLGAGKPVLAGLASDVRLTLRDVRRFRSGNVLLSYAPDRAATTQQPKG
jgi:dihydrofolate reductase